MRLLGILGRMFAPKLPPSVGAGLQEPQRPARDVIQFAEADGLRMTRNLNISLGETSFEVYSPLVCVRGGTDAFKIGYMAAERSLKDKIREQGVKSVVETRVQAIGADGNPISSPLRQFDFIRIAAVCRI